MTVFVSGSPDETFHIGYTYGQRAARGDIYCLTGELGAGKTVFAKGFAEGVAVPPGTVVVSPTFAIVSEYEGRLPFFHLDVYRCVERDMEDIGLDDYLYGGGVALIEWAGNVRGLLPGHCVWIDIQKDPFNDNIRHIHEARTPFC